MALKGEPIPPMSIIKLGRKLFQPSFAILNACRLVKERNPGGGVQEGEVGMKELITDNCSLG